MLMFAQVRQVLSALPNVSAKTFPSPLFSQQLRRSKTKVSHLWVAPLKPVRNWLEAIKVADPQQAHLFCKFIPAQCPFERDIHVGSMHWHIPPLCKLNPFYEELVFLRFRALSYLADECGEDVTCYCQAAPKS
jgi:Mo-dependent nitrogenase C-terminus